MNTICSYTYIECTYKYVYIYIYIYIHKHTKCTHKYVEHHMFMAPFLYWITFMAHEVTSNNSY